MCTLSWVRREDGYTVLFNRDERRTRSAGVAPAEQMVNGVRFLAPTDPDGGGSWVSVNDRRVALCILNQYDVPRQEIENPVSRGQLLLGLAHLSSQAEVWNAVRTAGLMQFPPFTLAVFEPGLPVHLLGWDGDSLVDWTYGSSGMVVSSSSVAQLQADESRRSLFEKAIAVGAIDEDVLDRLHRSHLPEEGALSVCMHRSDAETVSLTKLVVGPSEVRMEYFAGPPCRAEGAVSRKLAVDRSALRVPSSAY